MEQLNESYTEKFALIIGINKYKNISDLEYAVNDAESVEKVLVERLGYKKENITTLLDEEATAVAINDAFALYRDKAMKDDSILFFFAGHGTTISSIRDSEVGYLVPHDGTETNINTLIKWKDLESRSEEIRAKHIFFVMDACYSGLALQRSALGSKRFVKEMMRRYSRQILTAGKSNQKVKDSGGKTNNSIFTSYFLEAISGSAKTEEGILSASSVMSYVYSKVSTDPNSTQTPSYGSVYGEGDFIFNSEEVLERLNSGESEGKENDILIEIPDPSQKNTVNPHEKFVTKLKRLISDDRNYIKTSEFVDREIKEFLIWFKTTDFGQLSTGEDVKKRMTETQEKIANLCSAVVLLIYYGDTKYEKIVSKVFRNAFPGVKLSGYTLSISLKHYPLLILYYYAIMAAIESDNLHAMKNILNIEVQNNFDADIRIRNNEKYLLDAVIYNTGDLSSAAGLIYPDKNFKFPLHEHLYKAIQPYLEDMLFLGDGYADDFIMCEMIISIAYAVRKISSGSRFWAPPGRYLYQLAYGSPKLEGLPVDGIASRLGLYDGLEDRSEFYRQYDEFLSKHFF